MRNSPTDFPPKRRTKTAPPATTMCFSLVFNLLDNIFEACCNFHVIIMYIVCLNWKRGLISNSTSVCMWASRHSFRIVRNFSGLMVGGDERCADRFVRHAHFIVGDLSMQFTHATIYEAMLRPFEFALIKSMQRSVFSGGTFGLGGVIPKLCSLAIRCTMPFGFLSISHNPRQRRKMAPVWPKMHVTWHSVQRSATTRWR